VSGDEGVAYQRHRIGQQRLEAVHPPTSAEATACGGCQALKPGGAWYMSFKTGSGERAAGGRLFIDHYEETLRLSLEATPVEMRCVSR
jgi:hypothetical protein